MAAQCPKCGTENPADSKYCKECATPLPFSKELHVAHTKTLETSVRRLELGTLFAGRYVVLQELGRGGMGVVYSPQLFDQFGCAGSSSDVDLWRASSLGEGFAEVFLVVIPILLFVIELDRGYDSPSFSLAL